MDGSFLKFLGISILVIVAPGPDTALTIRNSLRGGRAGGIGTALGVSAGQLVWATVTSVGLVAVLTASEPIFRAVTLAGAAYLVWLGAQSLLAAVRSRGREAPSIGGISGILSNLGNPKMAVFFASVLPRFTANDQGFVSGLLLLGAVFSALTFAWLALYATVIEKAGRFLRRSAVRRAVEAATGVVLIGLGARVATEAR